MKRRLLALLIVTVIAGCGFHARQAPNLPPAMRLVYISAPGDSTGLVRELRRGLASDQTQISLDPTAATATLDIYGVVHNSRPLSVDRFGHAIQHEAVYQVQFSLMANGVVVLEPQTLTLTRAFNFSVSNALGNEQQANVLYDALAQQMAQLIIFRIQAAVEHMPAAALATTAKPVANPYTPSPIVLPAPASGSPPAPTTDMSPAAASAAPPPRVLQ